MFVRVVVYLCWNYIHWLTLILSTDSRWLSVFIPFYQCVLWTFFRALLQPSPLKQPEINHLQILHQHRLYPFLVFPPAFTGVTGVFARTAEYYNRHALFLKCFFENHGCPAGMIGGRYKGNGINIWFWFQVLAYDGCFLLGAACIAGQAVILSGVTPSFTNAVLHCAVLLIIYAPRCSSSR